MKTITAQEIQTNPTAFLQRVESGEAFLVMRGERQLAEVRPLPAPREIPRPFGLCAGQFSVPSDFDYPLSEEILKELEGK